MNDRSPLAGLRLGLTYGAALVILGLIAAVVAAPPGAVGPKLPIVATR